MFNLILASELAVLCALTGAVDKDAILLPVLFAILYPDNVVAAGGVAFIVVVVLRLFTGLIKEKITQ